jgi:hypothetical protein
MLHPKGKVGGGDVAYSFDLKVQVDLVLHIVKDIVKHHFIYLFHHPSVHPSGHPSVSSWSVYSEGAEKEWNTDVTR